MFLLVQVEIFERSSRNWFYFLEDEEALIEPQIIDAHNSSINSKIIIRPDHVLKILNTHKALKIGLSESIKRVYNIGILRIEKTLNLKVITLEIN